MHLKLNIKAEGPTFLHISLNKLYELHNTAGEPPAVLFLK
jgi:hypothetical protein